VLKKSSKSNNLATIVALRLYKTSKALKKYKKLFKTAFLLYVCLYI